MLFDKPTKSPREPRRMRRGQRLNGIGPVGRARLALNIELTEKAKSEDWYFTCELKPALVAYGLAGGRCLGPLTFCHSRKFRAGDPVLERMVVRGCEGHHFYVLDLLPPRLAEKIVLECITRRYMTPEQQAAQSSFIELASCSTCLFRLTKTPSHDPLFEKHLRHATLADLRTALGRTIKTKSSRRLIAGRIRQLEREARWRE